MADYDIYDLFAHYGYHARALKRPERNVIYLKDNEAWFESVDPRAATVLRGLGHQFEVGGTEALETPTLWEVPEIKDAGGLAALRKLGTPIAVMKDAKTRLFRRMSTNKTLGEVCESIVYGVTASAVTRNDGPRLLRITDITEDGVDWNVSRVVESRPRTSQFPFV